MLKNGSTMFYQTLDNGATKILTLLLLQALFLSACSFAAPPVKPESYVANPSSNGKVYYHLMYTLTAENLINIERMSHAQFVENGGQFEVLINKKRFPINAPHCDGNIILRMPWVPPKQDLAKKYALYQAILAIMRNKQAQVKVALELNPYVEKTAQGLKLQYCNVFFRQAHQQYIPHVNALEPQ